MGQGPYRAVLALGLCLLASACARDSTLAEAAPPETQVPEYRVVLEGAPDEAFAALAEEALAVYRLRDEGAQSRAFLRRRAEGDLTVLGQMLRSRGWYDGTAEVALSPEAEGEVPVVTLRVIPGEPYRLVRHTILVTDARPGAPVPDAAALGSPVGRRAEAAAIVAAEDAAVGELRRLGHAYAVFERREAVADRAEKTVEVTSRLTAGRSYRFGRVRYEGVTAVPEEYLATYIPWKEGETFDGAKLREFQRRLSATGLFLAVSAEPPRNPPERDALPVIVRAEERRPRTVRAGLRFDTVEGPEAHASLTHRNLFGRNEQGTVSAVAGLETQRLALDLVVPQFREPDRLLRTGAELRHETGEAYDELGATLSAGIERRLDETWRVGWGGLLEASRIDDAGTEADAFLAGIPLFALRDTTDDPLDPTRGTRLRIAVTPFGGQFDDDPTAFLVLDATGSAYWRLTGDGRTVLAARARLATVLADGLDSVPPTRRLYAGGGGSVRGYAKDVVGPLDARNDPVGGLSAVEAGIELRRRLWGDFGGVLFLDAGAVSTELWPDLAEGVRVAAGIGFRYYSPVGPIRADIAFPLNPRDSDDPLQFYFSIGQAF